jgi:hypothetical protein
MLKERNQLGYVTVSRRIILKINLKDVGWVCGLPSDSCGMIMNLHVP